MPAFGPLASRLSAASSQTRAPLLKAVCIRAFSVTAKHLSCQTVIVTGGAKGIGRGITDAFLNEGASVVCADVDVTAADVLTEEWANRGGDRGKLHFSDTNVGSPDACRELVEETKERFGRIDVLVNNAGIQPPWTCVPIHELPVEGWHSVLEVNLHSIFYLCKEVLPIMMEQHKQKVAEGKGPQENGGGVIINIASVQGLKSQPGVPAYAASKGALLSLNRQLGMDYGKYGIRSVAINPGTVETPLVAALAEEESMTWDQLGSEYPLQNRVGQPSEIGSVAVFLASPKASFITSESINVDGGITALGAWSLCK